jgi:predicted dehydrogenase
MKFLVVGLGSMGKRRVRCLKSLGYKETEIIGFDLREDRRAEAIEKYQIKTIGDISKVDLSKISALFISTPPDIHNRYIQFAIDNEKPAFVEASVILEGLDKLSSLAKKKNVLIAPSCTMRFHPAIKDITSIVKGGKYGKVTNFSYHSGQYLPDWHPWEKVKDFYVGQKETGGGREIVPFELTWLVDVFGFPKNVAGFHGKTMDVGADIDDTYVSIMDFGRFFGTLTVDVVCRSATRGLILNMEYGQISWRWDEHVVRLYDAKNSRWIEYRTPEGQAAQGYNKNVIEEMYIEEADTFISAVKGKTVFPNTLDEDIKVLKILHKMEVRP